MSEKRIKYFIKMVRTLNNFKARIGSILRDIVVFKQPLMGWCVCLSIYRFS